MPRTVACVLCAWVSVAFVARIDADGPSDALSAGAPDMGSSGARRFFDRVATAHKRWPRYYCMTLAKAAENVNTSALTPPSQPQTRNLKIGVRRGVLRGKSRVNCGNTGAYTTGGPVSMT